MADQNCSSPSANAPIIITSTSEQIKPDVDVSNSISSSCDSKNIGKKCLPIDDEGSCNNQESKQKSLLITSTSEKKNGVKDTIDKNIMEKSTSFLRPSILSSSFSLSSSENTENTKTGSSFSLQCPKLNLTSSKFGDNSFINSTPTASNSAESQSTNFSEKEKSNSTEKLPKSSLEVFSSMLSSSSNNLVNAAPKSSVISVPNFVFGQNLHERVTDGINAGNIKSKQSSEINSNGTSEMLFTSVISSKEVKENFTNDSFNNSKDAPSLIENAAKCQEARASKRKYEEVLVTTGEEDEENILQVNVKLFAFDNGAWVERGRGILRLNDKKCDEGTSSRIVIRTVGNLRVVLNTKIWSKMSLSRASERSTRLTAIDPNGQVKIFLIQASIKDMTSLYCLLEERIKLCQEQNSENEGSPDKKIALEKK